MELIDGNEAAKRGFSKATWELTVEGNHWICKSPTYGSVAYAVVADGEKLRYDRPIYYEAPHIITVPYGEKNGKIRFGLVLEERPHGGGIFWGVPRGFLKSGETHEEAARREAGEEVGVTVIKKVTPLGVINPNPTFVGSSGPVLGLEVDLNALAEIRPSRNEKIYKAQFFSRDELLEMITSRGQVWRGGLTTDGVSLAALMLAFAHTFAIV